MAIEEITSDKLRQLVEAQKHVTNPQAKRRTEERYERADYQVKSADGLAEFRIYVRQNLSDVEDFSCGIRWIMPSGETLTLARYNGLSHKHDDIEYECHIHKTTTEAIQQGLKPERHAERSSDYRTVEGALHCLLSDFRVTGLKTEPDQQELFS